jgi:hypothetical protein
MRNLRAAAFAWGGWGRNGWTEVLATLLTAYRETAIAAEDCALTLDPRKAQFVER